MGDAMLEAIAKETAEELSEMFDCTSNHVERLTPVVLAALEDVSAGIESKREAALALRDSLLDSLSDAQREAFTLAATQCESPAGDEHGHFYCQKLRAAETDLTALKAELAELRDQAYVLQQLVAVPPMGDGVTHHEQCWKNRGHHACAIALVDAGQADVERFNAIDKLVREVPYEDCHIEHLDTTGWAVSTCFDDGRWKNWQSAKTLRGVADLAIQTMNERSGREDI